MIDFVFICLFTLRLTLFSADLLNQLTQIDFFILIQLWIIILCFSWRGISWAWLLKSLQEKINSIGCAGNLLAKRFYFFSFLILRLLFRRTNYKDWEIMFAKIKSFTKIGENGSWPRWGWAVIIIYSCASSKILKS